MGFFAEGQGPKRTYNRGTISLSDEGPLELVRFLGITEEDLGVIATWEEVGRGALEKLVDSIYQIVIPNPTEKGLPGESPGIDRQRALFARYVMTLFSGRLDDEYVSYRSRVGLTHDHVDLNSDWYVAMNEILRRVIVDAVAAAGASLGERSRFNAALYRLIQFDIAHVFTTLRESQGKKTAGKRSTEALDLVGNVGQGVHRDARNGPVHTLRRPFLESFRDHLN